MSNKFQSERGYTLAEVMIVIAIVAILAGVAVPSFIPLIKDSRMTSNYNSLVASLTLARSEAIKRSSNVSVCAMESESECGTDWANGWIVFTDDGGDIGMVDNGEVILKRVAIDDPELTVQNRARIDNRLTFTEPTYVSFGPRGTSDWTGMGYLLLCDDRGAESGIMALITLAGNVQKGRRDQNNQLINSWGLPVRC